MSLNTEPQMTRPGFDTHKHVKTLMTHGVKESQAEAIIMAIVEYKDTDLSKFVTTDQFIKLQHEVDLIKQEIRYIKENMVTKMEFETFKGEIKAEIATLRSEIASVKFDILKWIIPIMLTNTVAMLGLIISMFLKK